MLHYTALQLQGQLQLQLHYFTLHYTRLHHTILDYSSQHYSTLHYAAWHYTTLITPHHNYNGNCNYNYTHTNYTTLQLQIHYPTLQLQLQLRYTTLHQAVVGEVTTATIATTPTTFRSISGFALPFVIHNNEPLL